jgi:thioredoxin family protein
MWPFAPLWDRALSFDQFVQESTQHRELWTGVHRTAKVPAWASEAAAKLGRRFRFVVIAEDWCGDASSTVPVVARFAEAIGAELRILRRDEHPEVMDAYLSGTARAIPIVIVLTEAMEELGHWGSRPAELQAFVVGERARGRQSKAYFPDVRSWYAHDRGESTLREILAVMAGTQG